jgi:ubiquinone/menaquinone biosynthesis C-methylase UbiE
MNPRNVFVLEPTGERMMPESADLFTFWEHVYRYAFASRFVKGKRVLDIACGEGYGAAALQKAGASHVIGVDISEAACLHAHSKYGIDARPGTAEQIPLAEGSVDVVVSFETIEHVPNPGRFLDECVRVLAPGGMLIVSTPNKSVYGRRGQNPFHCSEMSVEEFKAALGSRFEDCRFYAQQPASPLWSLVWSLTMEKTRWNRIQAFSRLSRALRRIFAPKAIRPPTKEQRESASEVILDLAKKPRRFLNPHLLRPEQDFDREQFTYLVATAIR